MDANEIDLVMRLVSHRADHHFAEALGHFTRDGKGSLMDQAAARYAAELLWKTWSQEGLIDALPEIVRPTTRAEGYAIQAAVADVSGQATVGWKIAATSKAGQAHLQVDGPLAGRLLANRVYREGSRIPFGNNHMRVAEAEFCFRMARDLVARTEPYSQEEVLSAVASLHPAIEIPDSRYSNFCIVGSPQLIADNACAHYFVLGSAGTVDWRSLDLSQHVVKVTLNGVPDREGIGANVLGDPRIALTWLANELRSHGIDLQAGHIVTTGTSVVPIPIVKGSRLVADFGCLGTVKTELI